VTATLGPDAERPWIPGYGVPETTEGTLPWSWAEARLREAETYWVATLHPAGRPHLMPTWGAWHAGRIWLEGGAATRRARNIARNPAVSVAIELPRDGALVVEGTAAFAVELDEATIAGFVDAMAKYATPPRSYIVDPANFVANPAGGLWAVTPWIVFGWSRFPDDATRWRFG